jgi:hypothetical protein
MYDDSTTTTSHSSPTGQQVVVVVVDDPHITVTLPVLKYGYRTTPASWDELVQILHVERDIPRLSRSVQQQREYEVFRHYMREQFVSSLDYILISKFGVEAIEETASPGSTARPKWKSKYSLADMKTSITKLIPNDFPYFHEDGIEHYIYWKTKDPVTDQEIDQVKKELRQTYKAVDILFWVNPPVLKSIPEIDHVHFLFRREVQK